MTSKPGLAGAEAAEDGVEVRAVHVGDRAGLVDRGEDLVDLVLEDPERARVRDHQRRHVRAERLAQRAEVDPAPLVRADRHRLVADHRGRRRVRAVRRVRHEHLRALLGLAMVAVIGAGHEHPGQLAVGARRRLQRDRIEPADLPEQLGEQPHQLERALRQGLRVERMRLGQPGQPRRPLVDLRVVLHRARPERIEVQVDRLVEVRQPVVVAQQLELAHLRQAWRVLPKDRCRQLRLPGRALARDVRRPREADRPPLRTGSVEDERLHDRELLAGGRAGEGGAATGGVGARRIGDAHRVASSASTRRAMSSSVVSSVVAISTVSRNAGSSRSGR